MNPKLWRALILSVLALGLEALLTRQLAAQGLPPEACVSDLACGDGVDCTVDTCSGGLCRHIPSNAVCDDGLFCNGKEVCSLTGCQAPSEPACVVGSLCSEAADSCGGTTNDLWATLGVPSSGEREPWIELSEPAGEPARTLGRLSWLATIETDLPQPGTPGLFLEDIGVRSSVGRWDTTTPDGSAAHVTLDSVSGLLTSGMVESALVGSMLTVETGAATYRFLKPTSIFDEAEAPSRQLADEAFAREVLRTGWPLELLGPPDQIPPAYGPDFCFAPSPDYDLCSSPYCHCIRQAGGGPGSCELAIRDVLNDCSASLNPGDWLDCVRSIEGIEDCEGAIGFAGRLVACRRTSDRCYCQHSNDFPQYNWLCTIANDRSLYARATGLYPGERVVIKGQCTSPGNLVQTREATFEGPEGQALVIQCAVGDAYLLSAEPVETPGVAAGNRRLCRGLYGGLAADLDETAPAFDFDCGCTNSAQCPQKILTGSVQGLQNVPAAQRRVQVDILLAVENGASSQAVTATLAATQDDTTLAFRDAATSVPVRVFPGTTYRGFSPRLLPTGCQVTELLADGQLIPIETPGNIQALEVRCAAQECQGAGCQVAAVVRITGTVAGRPNGIQIAVDLDGQRRQQTVHGTGDFTIDTATAGAAFGGLEVINSFEYLGIGLHANICQVVGPVEGTVGAESPFVLGTVNCQTSSVEPPQLPANQIPRQTPSPNSPRFPTPDTTCRYVCSKGTSTATKVTMIVESCTICGGSASSCKSCPVEVITVTERFCEWVCPTGLSPISLQDAAATKDGVSASGRNVPDLSVQMAGLELRDGGIVLDSELKVSAFAESDEGLQGFWWAIDGDYVGDLGAGGHRSGSMPLTTLDTSLLPEGEHLLQVVAYDNHPESPLPAVAELSFHVGHANPCDDDASGPLAEIASPADGQLFAPGWIDFTATASDPNGVERVRFWVDGREIGAPTAAPYQTAWHASPGTYDLEARAIDSCGNETRRFATVSVFDACNGLAVPGVAITNLADGAWLEPEVYSVEADVVDYSGTGIDRVEFRVGSFPPQFDGTAPWRSSGHYLLNQGDVPIEVRAYDHCGRAGVARITIHIRENASACEVDDGPPTVAFAAPLAGAVLTEGEVEVIATVHDDLLLLAGALEIDGVVPNGFTVLSSQPSAYRWTWLATPGDHTLRLNVADVCWNVESAQITVSVVPDSAIVPKAPVVLPASLRVLGGPTVPPGPPLSPGTLIDFGNFYGPALTSQRLVRVFSILNDGGQPLTIDAIEFSGTSFELADPPTYPFVVPALGGEALFRVRPTGAGLGPVLETLTVSTSRGPHWVSLKVLIDPNEERLYPNRFNDDFESGNLAAWNTVSGTALTVVGKAAATGVFGLAANLTGSPGAAFAAKAFGETRSAFRTKFQFRPERLDLPEAQPIVIAAAIHAGNAQGWLQVRRVAGAYQVRGLARRDDETTVTTSWLAVPDGHQSLDFAWWAASEPGKNDGGIRLVTGSWTEGEALGLDNDAQRVERFRLGFPFGPVESAVGFAHFDNVSLWF